MFSSPTPAPGSRALASNALRSAGLIDRDERMQGVDDSRPGGRKSSSKIRSHRQRPIDAFKDSSSKNSTRASINRSLASRLTSSSSSGDALAIRGAAASGSGVGRVRRNAISLNTITPAGNTRVRRGTTVSVSAVDVLKQFVKSRWDPETGFLNLEDMAKDEFLKKNKVSNLASSTREATVLFKIAGQLSPAVQTISLANNGLQSGSVLAGLGRYLPKLANLSLANNKLHEWRDLDYISAKKGNLAQLKELVLIGNPLRELEVKHNRVEQYRSQISRKFPSLSLLDSEPVARIGFDAPQGTTGVTPTDAPQPLSSTFPLPMAGSFITGVDGGVVSNFLMRFFTCFDNQRTALLNAYDAAATFSLSCNTTIPTRARLQGLHHKLPNQKNLNWGGWITAGSRNLSRLEGENRTVRSLRIGPDQILQAMATLPKTKHDISGPGEKFCLDAFPVAHGQTMGLLLCVHGEFIESPHDGLRSFDRSFVLAPAAEGSNAKTNGWDVVILSDQLVVRSYSSNEAWKPGRLTVQAGEPPTLPPDQEQALESIPEPQKSMVLQVCARTNLNVKFSVDCLAGNGWDIDKAIKNFNEVKATLSGDAYLPQP